MKNIGKISLLVLGLVVFVRCDKQLDLAPLGQLDENTFYQTQSDFEAASLSPYSTLLNLYYSQSGQGWYQGVLYPSDEVINGNSPNDRVDFNWTDRDGQFNYLWNEFYKGIQRANVIINRLPLAKQFNDQALKDRFEAEAKFLRAYFHFQLAIHFGNPPVSAEEITSFQDANKPMSQPGEIWDLVISDLQFAKQNLPATYGAQDVGRVTSGAAAAFLGKVLLYRAQWENNPALYTQAAEELSSVVNSGVYRLMPDFKDNFDPEKENNAESLFEVQFSRGDFNPWLPTDFGAAGDQNVGFAGSARNVVWRPSCGPGNLCAPGANAAGYGNMHVTLPLQNAFEPNDPRIAYTYFREGDDFFGKPYNPAWSWTGSTPAKYVRNNQVTLPQPIIDLNNDRIIRYADVLLMLAEAKLLGSNDVAGAAALINQVRRRADPTGNILPDRLANASQEQMLEWLMHERRVELALEGHRYNDLVRWHRANLIDIATDIDFGREAANNNWSPTHLLKPIPLRELDLNAQLQQNTGY